MLTERISARIADFSKFNAEKVYGSVAAMNLEGMLQSTGGYFDSLQDGMDNAKEVLESPVRQLCSDFELTASQTLKVENTLHISLMHIILYNFAKHMDKHIPKTGESHDND